MKDWFNWHDVRTQVAAIVIGTILLGTPAFLIPVVREWASLLLSPRFEVNQALLCAGLMLLVLGLWRVRFLLRRDDAIARARVVVATPEVAQDPIDHDAELFEMLDQHEQLVLRAFIDAGVSKFSSSDFNELFRRDDIAELAAAIRRLVVRNYLIRDEYSFGGGVTFEMPSRQFRILSRRPELVGSSAPPRKVL